MTYKVIRDGQEYGPYTLADLQRYVASGNILPSDLARSEGMPDWVPVSQIIGTVPAAVPAPQVQSYGQVPQYSPEGPSPLSANTLNVLPPNLHWGVVLVLAIVTCGLFQLAWLLVQAFSLRKGLPENKAWLFYVIGVACSCGSGFAQVGTHGGSAQGGLGIAALVCMIIGHFQMKAGMEEYFTRTVPLNLHLSGVMTFFFNTVYFQYHDNSIYRWRDTGVLS